MLTALAWFEPSARWHHRYGLGSLITNVIVLLDHGIGDAAAGVRRRSGGRATRGTGDHGTACNPWDPPALSVASPRAACSPWLLLSRVPRVAHRAVRSPFRVYPDLEPAARSCAGAGDDAAVVRRARCCRMLRRAGHARGPLAIALSGPRVTPRVSSRTKSLRCSLFCRRRHRSASAAAAAPGSRPVAEARPAFLRRVRGACAAARTTVERPRRPDTPWLWIRSAARRVPSPRRSSVAAEVVLPCPLPSSARPFRAPPQLYSSCAAAGAIGPRATLRADPRPHWLCAVRAARARRPHAAAGSTLRSLLSRLRRADAQGDLPVQLAGAYPSRPRRCAEAVSRPARCSPGRRGGARE